MRALRGQGDIAGKAQGGGAQRAKPMRAGNEALSQIQWRLRVFGFGHGQAPPRKASPTARHRQARRRPVRRRPVRRIDIRQRRQPLGHARRIGIACDLALSKNEILTHSDRMSQSGPAQLFDIDLLHSRQARARRAGAADFLLRVVVDEFTARLGAVNRSFNHAIDVASPLPMLREALRGPIGTIGSVNFGVAESLSLAPAGCDLALSALALHFVNDLPGALAQIRRALTPDGLFMAALIGGESLNELRQSFAAAEDEVEGGASPRVIPFADLRDLGGLLQRAGFALPVTDSERLIVRYADPLALMRDLRAMGATNILHARRRRPLRRATLARMMQIYGERFSDPDGRIRATFDIVFLTGWAPHDSQQRPLAPGSAKARLADALRTREQKLGE